MRAAIAEVSSPIRRCPAGVLEWIVAFRGSYGSPNSPTSLRPEGQKGAEARPTEGSGPRRLVTVPADGWSGGERFRDRGDLGRAFDGDLV
jgi:hypothetical protein